MNLFQIDDTRKQEFQQKEAYFVFFWDGSEIQKRIFEATFRGLAE
jgi:hypothetical protein